MSMNPTGSMSSMRAFLENEAGQIMASIVLGLGLAAVFRKACHDNKCIVIKGPSLEDTKKFYYKLNDDCYKYERVDVACE
jgi:hypothetical protein